MREPFGVRSARRILISRIASGVDAAAFGPPTSFSRLLIEVRALFKLRRARLIQCATAGKRWGHTQ